MVQGKSFIFFSQTGCLLPLLIIFNLFFGRVFFKASDWLIIELILILLFMLNGIVLSKKIFSASLARKEHDEVIDVEAEVIADRKKLK